ncbi:MAG: hypothetical protein P1U40_12665, partial [Coxiellaceae bacterium]|nr:hypothetical protein [Coxiellaceae bacterium]
LISSEELYSILFNQTASYITHVKDSTPEVDPTTLHGWLISNIDAFESIRPHKEEARERDIPLASFPLCDFSSDTSPVAKQQAAEFVKKYHTVIRDQYKFIAVNITDGTTGVATADTSKGFMDRSQVIANYKPFKYDASTHYDYVFVGLEEMTHHIDTLVDCYPDPASIAKQQARQHHLKSVISARKKRPSDDIRDKAKENFEGNLKRAHRNARSYNIRQTDATQSRPVLLQQEKEHGRVEDAIDLLFATKDYEARIDTPWGEAKLEDIYHPVYSAQETWSMMLGVIAKHAQERIVSEPKSDATKVIRSSESTRPMRAILKEANQRERATEDYTNPPDWSPEARQAMISAAPDYISSASGGSALYYLKEENRTTEGKKLLQDGGVKELYVNMLTSQPIAWPEDIAGCYADHLLTLLDTHNELPSKVLMMIWLDRYNPNLARDVMFTFHSGRDRQPRVFGIEGNECDDTENNSKLWERITGGRALPEEYQIRIQATDIQLPITRCYGKYHDAMLAFKHEVTGLFDQYQAEVDRARADSAATSDDFITEQRAKIDVLNTPQDDHVEEPATAPAWTRTIGEIADAEETKDFGEDATEIVALKTWASEIITAAEHPKSDRMQQALNSAEDLPNTKEVIKAIVRLVHRKHGVFNLSGRYLSENNANLTSAKEQTGEGQRFNFLADYINNYQADYSSRGVTGTSTYNERVISKQEAETYISPTP